MFIRRLSRLISLLSRLFSAVNPITGPYITYKQYMLCIDCMCERACACARKCVSVYVYGEEKDWANHG